MTKRRKIKKRKKNQPLINFIKPNILIIDYE